MANSFSLVKVFKSVVQSKDAYTWTLKSKRNKEKLELCVGK